jgi:hypothetical protein
MLDRPADPRSEFVQATVLHPAPLRFDGPVAQLLDVADDQPLPFDDRVNEAVSAGEPVCLSEDCDAVPPVWWRLEPVPAHRNLIASERGRVLDCVSHVQHRITRASEIEVKQPHRPGTAPHDIPWPEVAVADDLAWPCCPRVGQSPTATVNHDEPGRGRVVAPQQSRERS